MPKDLKENRGECFVVFPDREAGYWALKRHKNYIGKRFGKNNNNLGYDLL